ncbi:MAG TPA: hypothetical protein VHE30_13215 [Polyangiaceae bacterium]|nr:hypothetical protein [Polyangiaceae bacterium]
MRRVILSCCVAGLLSACGGNEPRVVSAIAGLPEYTPEESTLFNDALSATVFGLPAEIPAAQDPKLKLRTQRADGVIPVRVSTVTEESLAGVRGVILAARSDGPPLYGSAPADSLEIHLVPGNPSLSQVQAADTSLVGKHFLLFVRRYADGGEAVPHYYGEGDSPDVRKAMESAKLLDAVSSDRKTPRP